MRVRQSWRLGAWVVLTALVAACGDSASAPAGTVEAPTSVDVEPLGTTSMRISWSAPAASGVTSYRIERRRNLEGAYEPLADGIPSTGERLVYFDNAVLPDTYYGYRIYAQNALGSRSPASTTGGGKTPPPPTLVVVVQTDAPNVASADVDGYLVTILGPRDTVTAPLASNGERRFPNMRAGQYLVFLRGLATNCGFSTGDSTRTATIVETGIQTETSLTYQVSCRDPQKGSLVVRYEQTGDTTDANGVRLDVAGLLTEVDPVDTARVFFRTQRISSRNETLRFDNLRRGAYDITLADINAPCVLNGTARRSLQVKSLSLDTVRYVVDCVKPVVEDTAGKPFIFEHRWSAASAPTGSKVSLTTTLDLTANANTRAAGAQASLQYAATVLRFDSARAGGDYEILTANGRTPGLVNFAAANADASALGGRLTLARFWFTVIGATGASTRTATTLTTIPNATLAELKGQTRIREATLVVGSPVGNANVPPTARANGPYTGQAGKGVTFSAAGSSDVDGTITGYLWRFGDGTTSNLDAPVKTYASAGSYTATLTVTDDKGATGQSTAAVTITSAGGGGTNQPPVARIAAPVTVAVGGSITLSGSASTDADGTIASYNWNFGDGTTATGVTAQKSFAAAGSYVVTLTVTDDKGATGAAQQTITVTGNGAGNAIIWSSAFGSVDPATKEVVLTVTLDLSADLAETPGPEALSSFIVDSLKWDPVVLQMTAFNFGPGQAQGVNQSDVGRGKIAFNGSTLATQNSGVLTIARLRFKVLGGTGARATTVTAVGPLVGTPGTGSYNYRPKTEIREATLLVP